MLTGKPDAGNPPVRFGGRGGSYIPLLPQSAEMPKQASGYLRPSLENKQTIGGQRKTGSTGVLPNTGSFAENRGMGILPMLGKSRMGRMPMPLILPVLGGTPAPRRLS